jgi:hypothetical protein
LTALIVAVSICIRLHNAYGIAPPARRDAMHRVAQLLQPVGVVPDWAICDGDSRNPPDRRCRTPPARGDIVLRLIHSPKERFTGALAFGYAVIDPGSGEGTLATVYPDRVERLAATAGVDMAMLLGTAMAHEVGHLLLGRTTHASAGLMREHWLTREVERRWSADWTFSRTEEATIRARLQPHAAGQVAARRPTLPSLDQRPLQPPHRNPERDQAAGTQVGDVPQR